MNFATGFWGFGEQYVRLDVLGSVPVLLAFMSAPSASDHSLTKQCPRGPWLALYPPQHIRH